MGRVSRSPELKLPANLGSNFGRFFARSKSVAMKWSVVAHFLTVLRESTRLVHDSGAALEHRGLHAIGLYANDTFSTPLFMGAACRRGLKRV